MLYGRIRTRDRDSIDDRGAPIGVGRHRGDCFDFIERQRRAAAHAVKAGRAGREEIAPWLFDWATDTRTLRVAWDYLATRGGAAPGPDGHTYADFDSNEVWAYMRSIGATMREGWYYPGPERVIHISKGAGRGTRPLAIQNIDDRVVQRAVVEIVQPLLDPGFDPRSFGFRPGLGPHDALATAEHHLAAGRRAWVVEDLRDAFVRIPIPRLLQLVDKYLRADDLTELVGRIVGGASGGGLRQGGSLSPLLLNLYLDHHLDRPWRKLYPEIPLLRYADDLMIVARSVAEAEKAHAALADLLRPTGMLLKGSAATAVRTLTPDRPAEWLGYRLERRRRTLHAYVADRAWERLAEGLSLAADGPEGAARDVIAGWLAYLGPCYPDQDQVETYARLRAVASDAGVEDIPGAAAIKGLWQRAYARWCRRRNAVREALA